MNNLKELSIALKAPRGKHYQSIDILGEPHTHEFAYQSNASIDEWIQLIFNKYPWNGCLLYNDEQPSGQVESAGGHCKGVIVHNDLYMGWLIHSVPKWPKPPQVNTGGITFGQIDHNECIYGQSFAWLVLPRTFLSDALYQLKLMQAHVYFMLNTKYEPRKRAPSLKNMTNILNLDLNVMHIGKHSKWGKDIFEELMVPTIGGMKCMTQTWSRPRQPPTTNVSRIQKICWKVDTHVVYNDEQDHSKWAISCDQDTSWVFLGDINAMESQFHRGGGGILIKNETLWTAMHSLLL